MSSLTYAGIPLLYDYQNVAQSFLDQYQRIEDLLGESRTVSLNNWQIASIRSSVPTTGIGLPRYNWPDPPPLRINQLYWPTGASRFAYGLFLINREQYTLLQAKTCSSGYILASSNMGTPPTAMDERGTNPDTVQFSDMYFLTPQRIGGCDLTSDLFLLPIVDRRYWWQFYDVDDVASILKLENSYCQSECQSTWLALLQYLLPGETFPTVPSAYGSPDCVEFCRQYANFPVFVDAVAASIGARVVCKSDGSISVERPTDAYTVLALNLNLRRNQIAGTHCSTITRAHLPLNVRVTFPKAYCYHLGCQGDKLALTYSTAVASCEKPGYYKTIHSTAPAMYECACSYSAVPTNLTALQALTNQVGADWKLWNRYRYDFTYAAPQQWQSCGYDDHVLWSFGGESWDCYDPILGADGARPGEGAEPEIVLNNVYRRNHFTRVQSLPLGCDVDSMFHSLGDTLLPDEVLVEILGDWDPDNCCEEPDSSGAAEDTRLLYNEGQVYRYCDCEYIPDPNYTIRIHDAIRTLCPPSESDDDESDNCEFAWARWHCEDNRWYVDSLTAATSSEESDKLVELCAQEDAERNVPYRCLKGTWSESLARWCYNGEEVWAIDHRMGAPFAEEGWKGLYQRMDYSGNLSSSSGDDAIDEIWVCVSLDCELPPEGCSCEDEEY